MPPTTMTTTTTEPSSTATTRSPNSSAARPKPIHAGVPDGACAFDGLDALYRAHAPALRAYARTLTTPDAADDATQEVFVRLARLGTPARVQISRAYLRRTLLNVVRGWAGRRDWRTASMPTDELVAADDARGARDARASGASCAPRAAHDDNSPSIAALGTGRTSRAGAEISSALAMAMEHLSTPVAEALRLRSVVGLSIAQVATAQAISLRTVARRHSTGLQHLRRWLDR